MNASGSAPSERPVVLAVRDAARRFGTTPALCGVNLTLRRGEWLGLLGPNGAGKTTLMRAVAGRVRLDNGQIELLGISVANDGVAAHQARARLGVVPQELALYPQLTARENLEVFADFHGVEPSGRRKRVAWALQWTGLEDRARQRCTHFSGGMKRRLNIACGVLHQPEVVLLDEPTVGVDPQSRARIWEMLSELRRAGATLLLTTHMLDEAQQVCERIVIIDHGRIIADGTLPELIQRTVGPRRRVHLTLDRRPCPDELPGIEHFADNRVQLAVDEIGLELSALLERARAAGLRVDDVHVEAPTLQSVFLHLTGRELRE